MKYMFAILISMLLLTSPYLLAGDSDKEPSVIDKTTDTAKEAYDDTKKVTKKTVRKAKDKTCNMINGKLECAAHKVKHSVKNAGDEVKDKANDIKRN